MGIFLVQPYNVEEPDIFTGYADPLVAFLFYIAIGISSMIVIAESVKEQGPIPLYSYPISQLPEDTALDALALAAKGKVYIAIVTFNDSEQKSGAEARGLKVPEDWNSISNKEWKKEEWENFQTEHFADKDNVRIAFTRPLVLKKSIV